jgi:hypothetical protein
MKIFDHDLDRLIRAAVQAEGRPANGPSFALESRILSQLGEGSREESLAILMPVFRRAIAVACVVMICTLTLNYLIASYNVPDARAIAEQALQLSLLP